MLPVHHARLLERNVLWVEGLYSNCKVWHMRKRTCGNLIRGGKSDSLLGNMIAEVWPCIKYTCRNFIQWLLSTAACFCTVCSIFHIWDFSCYVISDTIRMCVPACTCHMQYVLQKCDLITLLLCWVMCMILGDRTGILYCSGLSWMGRSTLNVCLTKMNRISNYSKLL